MSADPSPAAGAKNIDFQVVRDAAPRSRGRPTFLTPRLFIKICHTIEKGQGTSIACKVHQVSYGHFRFKIARTPRWEKRLKKAEDVRFALRHDFALAAIIEAGKKSWMAFAWYLERTSPERYSLRPVHRDDATGDSQPIGTEIPAERLAQYGRLMLEMAEENKAKAVEIPVVTESAG
jgi:hypothetical protein